MANKFYSEGDQRAARVNDLFALVATRYDLMNDLQSFGLHRLWKRRLVRLANPQPAERALDLCCGTGDIAFALARRGAQVVGLDFNRPMLAVAENKCRKLDDGITADRNSDRLSGVVSRPRFICGNALHVPFADDSFEIATIGYGLRNLESCEAGLREMQRVIKPGGRLLVLDFGKPENRCWRGIYFGYMKFFVPVLGRIICGDAAAYAYILESLEHYPAQRGVAEAMRGLGLTNVRIDDLLGGVMSIHCAEKAR
jgi:demethylmenaquinone methyltransferase/2-methoxy-6-polyprenyl-1,4-benzoquinol methylase